MAGTFAIVNDQQFFREEFLDSHGLTSDFRVVVSSPRRDWFASRGLQIAVAVFNHQVKPDRLLSNSTIRATGFRKAISQSSTEMLRAEVKRRGVGFCLGVARCNPA